MRQMRSPRTNRHSVRSDEIRGRWLVHWRTTAAEIGHASARRCPKARIENTRSRAFAGRGTHCRRNHHHCPILISCFRVARALRRGAGDPKVAFKESNIDHSVRAGLRYVAGITAPYRQLSVTESAACSRPMEGSTCHPFIPIQYSAVQRSESFRAPNAASP
jgi:hypothetical protein